MRVGSRWKRVWRGGMMYQREEEWKLVEERPNVLFFYVDTLMFLHQRQWQCSNEDTLLQKITEIKKWPEIIMFVMAFGIMADFLPPSPISLQPPQQNVWEWRRDRWNVEVVVSTSVEGWWLWVDGLELSNRAHWRQVCIEFLLRSQTDLVVVPALINYFIVISVSLDSSNSVTNIASSWPY